MKSSKIRCLNSLTVLRAFFSFWKKKQDIRDLGKKPHPKKSFLSLQRTRFLQFICFVSVYSYLRKTGDSDIYALKNGMLLLLLYVYM